MVNRVFEPVTFFLACDYELKHRIEDQDCRRAIFPRQIELMSRLGPVYQHQVSAKIAEVLSTHPYDDEPTRSLSRLHRAREELKHRNKISTALIVLEAVREKLCGQNLVDWAIKMWSTGSENRHLQAIAASMPPYDHFELADLRAKAFRDLGIQVPSLDTAVGLYAVERFSVASWGSDAALTAVVAELHDLCIELDYHEALYGFYMLHCAHEDIRDRMQYSLHLSEANSSNILSLMRTAMNECIQKYGERRDHLT